MVRFWAYALSTLAISAKLAFAAEETDAAPEEVEDPGNTPNLMVSVSTSFPAASEIFGVKLINGHPTEAVLSFHNEEPEPVQVSFIGGSLFTPDFDPQGSRIVRNLTASKYAVEIPAGEKQSVSYRFATEMHPQELRLNLAAVVSDKEGSWYTLQAYNSTISIVDPDTSIFDPQIIFLYLFLAGIFAGTIYFFYTIWILPYFPPKGKGGERAKRSSGGSKKVDPLDAVPVVGGDGPAVTTTAQAYNQDWIPAHHLQRPEARRVKSGGPRPKSKGKSALAE